MCEYVCAKKKYLLYFYAIFSTENAVIMPSALLYFIFYKKIEEEYKRNFASTSRETNRIQKISHKQKKKS